MKDKEEYMLFIGNNFSEIDYYSFFDPDNSERSQIGMHASTDEVIAKILFDIKETESYELKNTLFYFHSFTLDVEIRPDMFFNEEVTDKICNSLIVATTSPKDRDYLKSQKKNKFIEYLNFSVNDTDTSLSFIEEYKRALTFTYSYHMGQPGIFHFYNQNFTKLLI